MEMIYCPNCAKPTGFKRALGFGTLFMVLITLGLWLLVIPLYPARCITCGLMRSTAFWENLRTNPRKALTGSSLAAAIVIVLLAVVWIASPAPERKHDTAASSGQSRQSSATAGGEQTRPAVEKEEGFLAHSAPALGRTLCPALGEAKPVGIAPARRGGAPARSKSETSST